MACQTNQQTNGPCPNWTFSASTNRITTSGFTYDAAGNTTADGVNTYTWDAEGRLSGNTYDALGQLVQNGATAFPYDAFGNQAAWYTVSNGVWFTMFVPFQGQILADAANDVFFHRNALGSVGYTTQANGSYYEEYLYYPWGQIWANPAGRQYEQRFASMPFLDEATQPIFGTHFRTYPPRLGRWLSPDPLAGDVFNPQSLNRYAYVLNNPAGLIDPLGLQCKQGDPKCTDPADRTACRDADPLYPPCNPGLPGYGGLLPSQQDVFYVATGLMVTGQSAFCPEQFQTCLATLGGAIIGLDGTGMVGTLFNPCSDRDVEADECGVGGVSTVGTGIWIPDTGSLLRVSANPTGPIIGPAPRGPTNTNNFGPLSFWDALGIAIGCIFQMEPDMAAPMQAQASPQDSTEAPEGTAGQQVLQGPRGPLNPKGANSQAPATAGNAAGVLASTLRCLANVKGAWGR
jgi:RHS repeat-associated protein